VPSSPLNKAEKQSDESHPAMMKPVLRVDGSRASATDGRPVLDWPKACWNGGMLAVALIACPILFSWSAVALFAVTTYASLLVGHSVGMHRMMIHRSFLCPKPVERLLIYIGVLVGVAGPFGIIRIHDMRDWAQRQSACHDFFAHRRTLPWDLLWQLAYKFRFDRPPTLTIEPHLAGDPWYRFMDRTWRLHQLLPGVVFYAVGGWSWVIWGVCLRVFVSTAGHWTVTYFCHNPGPGRWRVKGAAVQASNMPGLGVITYGECWHNNHHAFPESARIGLEPGQTDPGWMLIRLLRTCGLATNVGVPRGEASQDDLALDPRAPNAVSSFV
jgi:fatty-acid desaturase